MIIEYFVFLGKCEYKKESETNITVVNNEILVPIDVHMEGVSDENTVPIVIELGEVLPKYLNMGNYLL